jgi:hypothetical protein
LREPNLGKTNPYVSLPYSLAICFAPSLADSIIFLTLTRLVVVINFVNFSFALFTPTLGDFQPCRLRNARQDKVSGDPCIECSCDTVGWRGDLAKVASLRSLPELGLGRVEGAPVA